jgi:spoIIIJ-associated protein
MENSENNPEIEKKLKEITEELISKMGFSAEVELKKTGKGEGEREMRTLNIKTEDSNFLIGQYGANLQSLQHIARILIRKKIEEKIDFIIDVNSYRAERSDSIIKLARNLAEEAIREKKAVVLRPMAPYERRIVHLELDKNEKIRTESIGEGEDRRVVIKPADLI